MAVASSVDDGSETRREASDPTAQSSAAVSSAAAPSGSTWPPPAKLSRRDEKRDAAQADREAQEHDAVRPLAPLEAVEQGHPDGHRSDDQGRQPGRHPLLRPGHEAVAAEKEQSSDQRRRAPVARLRPGRAPRAEPPEEQGPRGQVANPGEQKRGDRLDPEADGEVRRAPEDVHRGKREHELDARGGPAPADHARHGASPRVSRSRGRLPEFRPPLRRRAG